VKVVIFYKVKKIGKYGKEIGENRNFHIVGIDTTFVPDRNIISCKTQ